MPELEGALTLVLVCFALVLATSIGLIAFFLWKNRKLLHRAWTHLAELYQLLGTSRTGETSLRSQLESLAALYRIIDGKPTLPLLGDSGPSPESVHYLLRHIYEMKPNKVVQCGASATTVIVAWTLSNMQSEAKFYVIESNPVAVDELRKNLAERNLESSVSIVSCPLVPRRYGGFAHFFYWYDLKSTALPDEIDLLVVDGAPEGTWGSARYPVGPELFPKLARHAHVFLYDSFREKPQLSDLWRNLYPNLGVRQIRTAPWLTEMFFLDYKIEAFLCVPEVPKAILSEREESKAT